MPSSHGLTLAVPATATETVSFVPRQVLPGDAQLIARGTGVTLMGHPTVRLAQREPNPATAIRKIGVELVVPVERADALGVTKVTTLIRVNFEVKLDPGLVTAAEITRALMLGTGIFASELVLGLARDGDGVY